MRASDLGSKCYSLRLVIQHLGTEPGRQSTFRLLVYGDRQVSRDFKSLDQLIDVLRSAGLPVDITAFSPPTEETSSILLSQSLELTDAELALLGLKVKVDTSSLNADPKDASVD
jgi:hypothetical protein